ncbi:MAG: hypothetical protein IKP71_00375 [Candidatus Riflebacteria bacterium]|nr:hypothetical protein [Candidatus Riflebacteria bacterium]
MKKIIYLVFILNLISISIVWSDDFSDYYPEQTDALINLNIDESKEYLSWAKDSMMNKTYNEVLSCLKEKLSVDILKNLKEIKICFINVKMGFLSMDNAVPFFFVNGDFKNNENWHNIIKSTIKGTTNEEAEITKLIINGSEKEVFTTKNLQFIQLSDNLIFIGIKGSSRLIERKTIKFVKAPKALINLSKQAKSYAFFTRKNLWKIIFLGDLFYESEHFISVSVYIKDNVINFIGNLDDPNVVEEEAKIFKEDINKFYKNYKKYYEQEKKLLKNTPLNYFPIIAKRTYLDALYKKIIDNISVKNNEDSIIVSLPFEKYLIKHIIFNLVDAGIFSLSLHLNNYTLSACIANQKALAKALNAYNRNDNSDLHFSLDLKNKNYNKDEFYLVRKIKDKIEKPNNTGKTTMFIDVDTLLKNDCLDIEPIKPDPECEYVAYRGFDFNNYIVYCLKHSFYIPSNRTSFGRVFRGGSYDPGFLNPGKKQILNSVECYKNQSQLIDSVEKYNKSHELKMKELNISLLIKSGIIEKAPIKPDFQCEYYSEGDLTSDDGCIYCKTHGPESYKIGNEKLIQEVISLRNIKLSKVDFDKVDRKDIRTIRECNFNVRSITAAITRNNEKENSKKITTDLNIADMLDKKLLWRYPRKEGSECEYYIEGDMTQGGHVTCKKHGYIIE